MHLTECWYSHSFCSPSFRLPLKTNASSRRPCCQITTMPMCPPFTRDSMSLSPNTAEWSEATRPPPLWRSPTSSLEYEQTLAIILHLHWSPWEIWKQTHKHTLNCKNITKIVLMLFFFYMYIWIGQLFIRISEYAIRRCLLLLFKYMIDYGCGGSPSLPLCNQVLAKNQTDSRMDDGSPPQLFIVKLCFLLPQRAA